MNNKNCTLCNNPLTQKNDSKEHIIPNSIGGFKTIKGFICRDCNSQTGDEWDNELAKQFNLFNNWFDIKKDRGAVPPENIQSIDGELLKLYPDGKIQHRHPKIDIDENEDGSFKISMMTRDIKEANQKIKELKRKFPNLDVEEAISKVKSSKIDSPIIEINAQFGQNYAWKSIIKIALAFTKSLNIDTTKCYTALNALKNETSCDTIYYESDLLLNRPSDKVFHLIHIQGNPETNQLIGYVELYGFHRTLMILNDAYTGDPISKTYAFDPSTSEELNINVEISFTNSEIIQFIKKPYNHTELQNALGKVIEIYQKRSQQKELDITIQEAIEYAFNNCGAKEGEILQEHHTKKITELVLEKIQPFIIKHIR
ncbi:hypothetical protein B9T13_07790 [Wohlfahrtiimonas chitiniclastica]|uniref:HNH endonuclease n=1 Tax=Wohlfahrtiimonas chitiniclastica TaxID=400946 RepID=UPI000B986721|nr:HNH endonuclease [Wohlfahrtiimonas chitiniclastica]OYQ69456.1 hypothetical protein B9T13_07790 [Wohlfahrtiimonas chitiniclastica]